MFSFDNLLTNFCLFTIKIVLSLFVCFFETNVLLSFKSWAIWLFSTCQTAAGSMKNIKNEICCPLSGISERRKTVYRLATSRRGFDLYNTICKYMNLLLFLFDFFCAFSIHLIFWWHEKKKRKKRRKKSVFMFLSSHPSFLLAFGGRSRCCSLTPSTSTSLAEGSLFFSVALSLFRKLIWLVARKTRGAGLHPSAWETSEREEKKRRAFFNNACYTSSKLGVIGGGGGLAGGEMFGIRLIFSIGFYSSTSFFSPSFDSLLEYFNMMHIGYCCFRCSWRCCSMTSRLRLPRPSPNKCLRILESELNGRWTWKKRKLVRRKSAGHSDRHRVAMRNAMRPSMY